ncbi:MAG: hypothetical protein GY780_10410 [bacterium]|nr:hypothetical protein [bacterium]
MIFVRNLLTLLSVLIVVFLSACSEEDVTQPPEIILDEHSVLAHEYLNHRFFKLDLPANSFSPLHDTPGRNTNSQFIEVESIRVFQLAEPGLAQPQDVPRIAVYQDSTGVFWDGANSPDANFSEPYIYGPVWRQVDFELLLNVMGDFIAIDMGQEMSDESVLAVTYQVVDSGNNFLFKVGDRPGFDEDSRIQLPNEGDDLYYRLKLLKAPVNQIEVRSFYYVLRNIYSIGFQNIDSDYFEMNIFPMGPGLPGIATDEQGISYLRIFGLDQTDNLDLPEPDGLVDLNYSGLDLARGLLKYPLDFPHPFSAGEQAYTSHADDPNFVWDETYLQLYQSPQLYDPWVNPTEYASYSFFRMEFKARTSSE